MLQMYLGIKSVLNFRRTLSFLVFRLWCRARYFTSSLFVDPCLRKGNRLFFFCDALTHACQNASQNFTVNTFIWKILSISFKCTFFLMISQLLHLNLLAFFAWASLVGLKHSVPRPKSNLLYNFVCYQKQTSLTKKETSFFYDEKWKLWF